MKTHSNPAFVALLLILLMHLPAMVAGQSSGGVAIGDSLKVNVDPSAMLEIFSDSKGFLPPRLTSAQRNSISNPASGLVVYDTDLDKLVFYQDTSWEDFGLWVYKSNFLFAEDQVRIGQGADTLPGFPVGLVVTSGYSAIASSVVTDTPSIAAKNYFSAQIKDGGESEVNTFVQTQREGDPAGIAMGLVSFMESNANMSAGMGTQVMYTGVGNDSATVAGTYSDTYVEDSMAQVLAVGGMFNSSSEQAGSNVGVLAGSSGNATYSNTGLVAYVETDTNGNFVDSLKAIFPDRFTAAAVLNNAYSDSMDFNLYAFGTTKSYFGGNVGIGVSSPTVKLDVAGAINSAVYMQDGDTVALGSAWSENGNDIYYTNGNVGIGIDTPALALQVSGGFAAGYATEGIFPESALVMDSTGLVVFRRDTAEGDTIVQMFNIVQADAGVDHGIISMTSLNNTYASVLGISGSNNGIEIATVDSSGPASVIQSQPSAITLLNGTLPSDTSTLMVIDENGIGINTPSPDTELDVNGDIKQKITTSNVSNPPTDSELDTLFTGPASKGDGWTTYVKDSDSNNLYQVVVEGSAWYIFSASKAN